MKSLVRIMVMSTGMVMVAGSYAAAPASAPAGSTGQCKDGTYYSGASKQGACHGHQGVKEWYGGAPTPVAATPATAVQPAPAPKPAPAVAPAAPAAAATTATATTPRYTPASTAAPGGGSGKVWANAESKVYHCPNDQWYGKTKSGAYMSEADAKIKGYHPDHGKACQ
jgi:hypothetical protein